MLSAYRDELVLHLKLPHLPQLPPWHAAFKNEVFSRPRSDRIVMNLSIRTRLAIRNRIARRSLRGVGLEIGAQNVPTAVDPRVANVEYIDRLTTEQMAVQFGIPLDTLVPVTHLVDGVRLDSFEDASYDFLIANHVLEHFDDPVGGVIEWLRILKPGARLFITLPNFRSNPFDFRRRPPTRAHFLKDFEDAAFRVPNNRAHYAELIQSMYDFDSSDPLILATADQWIERGDRQHYHVYDEQALRDVLTLVSERVGGVQVIDHFLLDSGFELLLVIEKGGAFTWPDPVASRAHALSLLGRLAFTDVLRFYATRRSHPRSAQATA